MTLLVHLFSSSTLRVLGFHVFLHDTSSQCVTGTVFTPSIRHIIEFGENNLQSGPAVGGSYTASVSECFNMIYWMFYVCGKLGNYKHMARKEGSACM